MFGLKEIKVLDYESTFKYYIHAYLSPFSQIYERFLNWRGIGIIFLCNFAI